MPFLSEQTHAEVRVMGISSRVLGPLFITLGSIIVIFALGLISFTCVLHMNYRSKKRKKLKKRNSSVRREPARYINNQQQTRQTNRY